MRVQRVHACTKRTELIRPEQNRETVPMQWQNRGLSGVEKMKECCVFSVNDCKPLDDDEYERMAAGGSALLLQRPAARAAAQKMVTGQKKSSILLGPKTRPKSMLDFVNDLLFVGL
jgi:hypothetical protein